VCAMKPIPIPPLSCMKWGDDGDLSKHDTAALIARLSTAEKARRGLLDHHNFKLGRSVKPIGSEPMAI
jgi:hypothetical protein